MTSIDRADLEGKLREIEGVVTEFEDKAMSKAKIAAVAAGVVVVGLAAYLIWKSKHPKIRIEVYKQ
jgi:hypothetical protein